MFQSLSVEHAMQENLTSAELWHFVQTPGKEACYDKATRKKIRENAMRYFRRNERLARMQIFATQKRNFAGSGELSGQEENRDTIADKNNPMVKMIPYRTSSSVSKAPGSGFDPFSCTSFSNDQNAGQLVEYCS